jgi:hypothetical protein
MVDVVSVTQANRAHTHLYKKAVLENRRFNPPNNYPLIKVQQLVIIR